MLCLNIIFFIFQGLNSVVTVSKSLVKCKIGASVIKIIKFWWNIDKLQPKGNVAQKNVKSVLIEIRVDRRS